MSDTDVPQPDVTNLAPSVLTEYEIGRAVWAAETIARCEKPLAEVGCQRVASIAPLTADLEECIRLAGHADNVRIWTRPTIGNRTRYGFYRDAWVLSAIDFLDRTGLDDTDRAWVSGLLYGYRSDAIQQFINRPGFPPVGPRPAEPPLSQPEWLTTTALELLAHIQARHCVVNTDDEIHCNCGVIFKHVELALAASAHPPQPAQSSLSVDQIQLLAWAIGNCHMLARRALAKTTSAFDREKWEHVLRICEKAGARSEGVLRASLPTEMTEGAASAPAPNPPKPSFEERVKTLNTWFDRSPHASGRVWGSGVRELCERAFDDGRAAPADARPSLQLPQENWRERFEGSQEQTMEAVAAEYEADEADDKATCLNEIRQHHVTVVGSADWADLPELLHWYRTDVHFLLVEVTALQQALATAKQEITEWKDAMKEMADREQESYSRTMLAEEKLHEAEADLAACLAQLTQPKSDRFLLNEYGHRCWEAGHAAADAEIARLRVPQWQSTNQTMPKAHETVLLHLSNGFTASGYFSSESGWYANGWSAPQPTHWMPLPAPPEIR